MIAFAEIEAARERLAGSIVRTPLVRLELEDAPAEIYLKLENLQPIGSFKLRGAGNALLLASPEEFAHGVWTASAGNMAQGVAWWARRLGTHCTVVLPDTAPETKIAAIRRLGGHDPGHLRGVARGLQHAHVRGPRRSHVHAFSDDAVMAGNGTIGLEIARRPARRRRGHRALRRRRALVRDRLGTARARPGLQSSRPRSRRPLHSRVARGGQPVQVEYTPSFVDGIGAPEVLAEMCVLAQELLDGSLVIELAEVEDAVRLLAGRVRVVAEGAGAAALAVARTGTAGTGKVVCVVSGGNIDSAKLSAILTGASPG